MRESTTHLVGPAVAIRHRIVQRCAICGEKLCDSENVMMPLNPDGTVPTFPVFEAKRLLRVTGGNPKSMIIIDDDKTPEDLCIDLVE